MTKIISSALLIFIGLIISLLWIYQTETIRVFYASAKYFEVNTPKQSGFRRDIYQFIKNSHSAIPLIPATPKAHISEVFEQFKRAEYTPSRNKPISVKNEDEFIEALSALDGTNFIVIESGIYRFNGRPIMLDNPHSEVTKLITGRKVGDVIFELDKRVGFEINSSGWAIEGIVFKGDCDIDAHCEHAFHLKGDADNITFTNNDFVNFNAAIKSNGEPSQYTHSRVFPDFVTLKNNRFYNEWTRDTSLPVTPVDVVGGDFWQISNNFFADFAKDRGNKVAYGAFLKGGGKHGVISNNIVACSFNLPYRSFSDVRVGLSIGGGGTGKGLCQSADCEYEHKSALISSNVLMNCLTDVSIYLNNARDVNVINNILSNSTGIDVANNSQSIIIKNNKMHGSIRNRSERFALTTHDNSQYGFYENILIGEEND